jgi:ribonuclease Z
MKLTITGYSTALFATWYFVEETGLLFDAGDGLTSALLQKARKIDRVFVSHADRDHLTGLHQFNQLNARPGFPKIYFPLNCGSFPAIEAFAKKFDPHVSGTEWHAIKDGDIIRVKDDLAVQAVRNNHVKAAPDVFKSLGYRVNQIKTKLKPEYLNLPQNELKELITTRGKENLTEQIQTTLLAYSGDTPVDDPEKWNNSKILIHEATFIGPHEQDSSDRSRNLHSRLEEVLYMAGNLNIETLILGHFSSRYSHEEIDANIKRLCKELKIKIPVYRVLPGQVHRNILGEQPLN